MTALQKAINAYLALDPESPARVAKLDGKVVTVKLLPINMVFQLIFSEHLIQLQDGEVSPADTIIEGTPLRLLHLALSPKKNRQQFFSDDVSIQGNLELGQLVIDLFDQVEIDWEEKLSRIIGDAPSHQVNHLVTSLGKWVKQTKDILLQDVSEYVQEEAGFFPTREALQDFFQDVDVARMDADRLEAKIKHLEKRMAAKRSAK